MNFKTKYKINLYKAYFDKGLGLTNYLKYFILLFGIYEVLSIKNVTITFIMAILYAVGCFFLGWFWYKSDFIKAEIEVGNNFNLFVKEMRKKIK